MNRARLWQPVLQFIFILIAAAWRDLVLAGGGELRLTAVDQKTGQPVPCRMHLHNAAGKPVFPKGLPSFGDHFVFPGRVKLRLPRGGYTFEIERGPEYVTCRGHFTIEDHADDEKTVELKRAVDMAAEGWWSADFNVRRALRDIELLMQADDLHVAAIIGAAGTRRDTTGSDNVSAAIFDGGRRFYTFGCEDTRAGNRLIYLSSRRGLSLSDSALEKLGPLALAMAAQRDDTVWLDVARPSSWDLPVLVALGLVDSVELAADNVCRRLVVNSEGETRPRDKKRLPPPHGGALWSQQIYYHLLNCGLRIPPTAGSGSGEAPNPVGHNRVYVHVGDQLDVDAWWRALGAGQVMVTNGPLIRPEVRGQLPGHVFQAAAGEEISLDVNLTLSTRDPIRYLEIIKNGQVEQAAPLDEWAATGRLAPLNFTESGWFLIRVVTDLEETYRFASTGPYFVEIGEPTRRVSLASAQFFRDWTRERMEQLRASSNLSREELKWYEQALAFWEGLIDAANAP